MTTDELMALADRYANAHQLGHQLPYGGLKSIDAREALRTALEAVVEDAARYRAVRGKFILSEWGSICIPTGHTKFVPEQTDAAIDAARRTA